MMYALGPRARRVYETLLERIVMANVYIAVIA